MNCVTTKIFASEIRPGFTIIIEDKKWQVYEKARVELDGVINLYVNGRDIPFKFFPYHEVDCVVEDHEF